MSTSPYDNLERREIFRRDMNPHKPARFAMWMWCKEYAASGLGSMGFWDRLSDNRKAQARDAISEIEDAPSE